MFLKLINIIIFISFHFVSCFTDARGSRRGGRSSTLGGRKTTPGWRDQHPEEEKQWSSNLTSVRVGSFTRLTGPKVPVSSKGEEAHPTSSWWELTRLH